MVSTRLRRGDQVHVLAGKDKGKKGRVLRIDRESNRVIVEGLNLVKKTQRPKNKNDKGGIIEIEAPIQSSNVMIFCKKCSTPRRSKIEISGSNKNRVCRKCGEIL